jgi:hypothetical protein
MAGLLCVAAGESLLTENKVAYVHPGTSPLKFAGISISVSLLLPISDFYG